jgi:hypothetical protein
MADLIGQTDKEANPACHCLVSVGNQFCGERRQRIENARKRAIAGAITSSVIGSRSFEMEA